MTVKELREALERLENDGKAENIVCTSVEAHVPYCYSGLVEIIGIDILDDNELTDSVELIFN